MRDEAIGRGSRADHNQSVVNIRSAIDQWIGNAHAERDETAAGFGGADNFLAEPVRRERVSPFTAKMAEKKPQRRQMNAWLCMIMNRVEAKGFRVASVCHQCSRVPCPLGKFQDGSPIMRRRDLCKELITIGDAE